MSYECPKGHISTDPDYCSECGAKIGKSSASSGVSNSSPLSPKSQEICPDCGTERVRNDRFCEVCRHDFLGGNTGTAEKVVAAQQPEVAPQPAETEKKPEDKPPVNNPGLNTVAKNDIVIADKLNIVISVDKDRLAQNLVESNIKPDSMDRTFPLDLDENLVGRRSADKGVYPEIEVNDPGVSRRQLKFIKQADGAFAVLELGSANGTEYNGAPLEAGINTLIKAGDEFAIGLWTTLKVVAR